MKQVSVPVTPLGTTSLGTALDVVFGDGTLRSVHGEDLELSPFDGSGRRSFTFGVGVKVPAVLRGFFCGSVLRVTTHQELSKPSQLHWHVRNRLRLHFVGSELFRIEPTFWLRQRNVGGEVCLGGEVRHHALLFPPLNLVAERFMAARTADELRAFARVLGEKTSRLLS